MPCPALLIAAPASGQGKTTVTAALARLHARQGRRVRVFKSGPDFLDPYWHALASGAPVYNLDLWMNGEPDCRARLAAAAEVADLILVEGVMGLFDGEPSAADLARCFQLPVLAVVDASAMAGTFGALAFGMQHYQPDMPWAGVLANRVASARHAAMLQASVRDPAHWLGALPPNPAYGLPERHLGLTVAYELPDAMARLDAAADALAATALGQLCPADWARWNLPALAPTPPAAPNATGQPLKGTTIAIAEDAAFCFIYAANLDCLESMGARLVFFSPLSDSALPDCDALWLPGGYPELHAAQLATSSRTRDSLRAHVAAQKPVWAECGGMMVLFDTLQTRDGQCHAQWGILPGQVRMQSRLARLGPQQLALSGGVLRGHTFHYSLTETPLPPACYTAPPGPWPAGGDAEQGEAVWRHGSVHASYFHAWFPSSPAAVAELFAPVCAASNH